MYTPSSKEKVPFIVHIEYTQIFVHWLKACTARDWGLYGVHGQHHVFRCWQTDSLQAKEVYLTTFMNFLCVANLFK